MWPYARVAIAVLVVVIVVRIGWVMTQYLVVSWKTRRFGSNDRAALAKPTKRGGFLIAWCGMRGIVTLAAALALPDAFPGRPLILVVAFTVVVGTLIIQGLTLRPLLRWFDLRDDEPVEQEVVHARRATLQAAQRTLEGNDSEAAKALRFELDDLLTSEADEGTERRQGPSLAALRTTAVAAARVELKRLRFDESIGDDAYHRVELVLDRTELYAQTGQ